jgi:hypothetical protein
VGSKRPTGLELTLLGVVAAVILGAALIGGGDTDRTAAGGGDGATTQRVRLAPVVRRVERLRGLRFKQRLNVVFAPPQRATAIYEKASAAQYSTRTRLIDEEELKLLGLLRPDQDLGRYLRAIATEQVLGFYDDRSKRLVVVTGESGSRALQEITLAHELVHALEDQHFGIGADERLRDDSATAESALLEGTATALMIDYADRYFDLADALDAFGAADSGDTKLPPFMEELLLFPYEQGARFVNTFRSGGGWRAVDKVIRYRRPRTTEQVLHPRNYALGDLPTQVRVPDVHSRLGGAWKRLDATESGELDTRLVFGHVADVADPAASDGWDGGRFELWRRAGARCDAPCVARDVAVWGLAWDTTADRAQAERAFARAFEHGLKGRRLELKGGARGAVGLWASRGGAIGIKGRGRRTTIVFAPTPAAVATLLS